VGVTNQRIFLGKAMSSDIALILKAANFAAIKHKNDKRKDADETPYINHPLEVARILIEEGGVSDATVLAAAILHDTVEDTGTKPEELEEHFGVEVRDLVLEVTDDKNMVKETRKRLQIDNAPKKSSGAAMIKLADKIANLRDVANRPPAHWNVGRRIEYAGWAMRVVEGLPVSEHPLVDIFKVEFERCVQICMKSDSES
jgi:guanosine-3',5'-bis(diphosphate) 3'-pyrophosphohydrolase